MKVSRLLATKSSEVLTIRPQQTVREVIQLLARHNIGVLVVVDDRDQVAGIISERDIIRRAAVDEQIFDLPVSAVMTSDVVMGMPSDEIVAVVHTMSERNFRHLPIIQAGRLVGMISVRDILKAQRDEYRGEIDTLETQLLAETE
jgi:CBS domain-containing protein